MWREIVKTYAPKLIFYNNTGNSKSCLLLIAIFFVSKCISIDFCYHKSFSIFSALKYLPPTSQKWKDEKNDGEFFIVNHLLK